MAFVARTGNAVFSRLPACHSFFVRRLEGSVIRSATIYLSIKEAVHFNLNRVVWARKRKRRSRQKTYSMELANVCSYSQKTSRQELSEFIPEGKFPFLLCQHSLFLFSSGHFSASTTYQRCYSGWAKAVHSSADERAFFLLSELPQHCNTASLNDLQGMYASRPTSQGKSATLVIRFVTRENTSGVYCRPSLSRYWIRFRSSPFALEKLQLSQHSSIGNTLACPLLSYLIESSPMVWWHQKLTIRIVLSTFFH